MGPPHCKGAVETGLKEVPSPVLSRLRPPFAWSLLRDLKSVVFLGGRSPVIYHTPKLW